MSLAAASTVRRIRRAKHAAILGMGTASPPTLSQEQILQVHSALACETAAQKAWLERVYLRCGIQRRGTVLADIPALRAFYPTGATPGTAARMERYASEAPILGEQAAGGALAEAQIPARSITHLITVSCTGFFAPGLDAALIGRLGLSRSVRRLHVGFMGCHGAFNALGVARDAILADPKAKVLICSVELCTLHLAYGWNADKLVANAIFADGASAAVLGRLSTHADIAGGEQWRLDDVSSVLLPDCTGAMTWTIGDHGFEMTLSPNVPALIGGHLRPWCEAWLARHDLQISDIVGWAIHPGGPKVLTAIAEALGLEEPALRFSRQILAEQGNMSSATVLFILQRMAGEIGGGPCVAIGLGPGLVAEGMLLRR